MISSRWSRLTGILLVALGAGCTGVASDTEAGPGVRPDGPRPPATAAYASEVGARRLSQAELDHALRDLLQDDTGPATRILIEDNFAPYDNDYTLQRASEALVTGIEQLSMDVADRLTADAARRSVLLPCEPTGADDDACFRSFIEDFVPRALRRPVSDEEIAAYMTLQSFATEDNPNVDNDFYTAVGLVIRAVIQDPEFLYRIEVGAPTENRGVYALDGYEIATRMAFLILGSTPDDALLADAAAGTLETPDGRRSVAQRLFADERAKEQLHRFHAMWLGYRTIPHGVDLVSGFNQETTSLLDRVIFDDRRSYLDVFRLDETYLDTALAEHYELAAPAGGEGWVSYGDSGRAGILSHGSVLASFSKFTDTSPTQRGILIRTRLMCQEIPPPPPDVDVDDPPGEGSSDCKEDRYRAHSEVASCANCHNLFDPIGMGLERFDIAGRYRTHDDGRPECEIDGVGEYPGAGTFTGPKELADRLLEDGSIESCFVQQFYSFAIGRAAGDVERDLLSEFTETFRGGNHDLQGFIEDYVASERFALRREEAL